MSVVKLFPEDFDELGHKVFPLPNQTIRRDDPNYYHYVPAEPLFSDGIDSKERKESEYRAPEVDERVVVRTHTSMENYHQSHSGSLSPSSPHKEAAPMNDKNDVEKSQEIPAENGSPEEVSRHVATEQAAPRQVDSGNSHQINPSDQFTDAQNRPVSNAAQSQNITSLKSDKPSEGGGHEPVGGHVYATIIQRDDRPAETPQIVVTEYKIIGGLGSDQRDDRSEPISTVPEMEQNGPKPAIETGRNDQEEVTTSYSEVEVSVERQGITVHREKEIEVHHTGKEGTVAEHVDQISKREDSGNTASMEQSTPGPS